MDMTPLEALRALGIPDDEVRARAEALRLDGFSPADCMSNAHSERPDTRAYWRLNAAILRADDQLGPEREPVTRDTPLGTDVAHDDYTGRRWLVGWLRKGWLFTEDEYGNLRSWDPTGWHVVEGGR